MLSTPVVALLFGFEAFFPVAIASIIGALIWLAGATLASQTAVDRLANDLIYDLAGSDKERRQLVCSELNPTERKRVLSEIAQAEYVRNETSLP
jgi:hypothetical protein